MRRSCALLAGGLLMLQAGGGATTSQIVDRINAASTRSVPAVGPPEVARPDMVWVPDRYVPIPAQPASALVPGHWERRVSDREFYAPPQAIVNPSDGSVRVFPAGLRPPPEERHGP